MKQFKTMTAGEFNRNNGLPGIDITGVNKVTVYEFAEIEPEDYNPDVTTEKQRARNLIAMGYIGIEDPDIIETEISIVR